ncbi:MAG TPA: hypothetical protein V6C58_24430 [Allocoleopsis sp.]
MKLVFIFCLILQPWFLIAQPVQDFQDLTFHLRVAKDTAPVVSLFIQRDRTMVLWRNNNNESRESKNNGLFNGVINEKEYSQILSLLSNCELNSSNLQGDETIYPAAIVIATFNDVSRRTQIALNTNSGNPAAKLSNYLVKYIESVKFKKVSGYYDFDL